MALTFADSLGVGARVHVGHPGILEQLAMIGVAVLFGVAPWAGPLRPPARPAAAAHAEQARDGAAADDTSPDQTAGQSRAPPTAWQAGSASGSSRVTNAGAATIIASLSVVVAALVVIINGLASAPASGLALVIAGGAAVLVVAVRILHAGPRERRRGADVAGGDDAACATWPTAAATWC